MAKHKKGASSKHKKAAAKARRSQATAPSSSTASASASAPAAGPNGLLPAAAPASRYYLTRAKPARSSSNSQAAASGSAGDCSDADREGSPPKLGGLFLEEECAISEECSKAVLSPSGSINHDVNEALNKLARKHPKSSLPLLCLARLMYHESAAELPLQSSPGVSAEELFGQWLCLGEAMVTAGKAYELTPASMACAALRAELTRLILVTMCHMQQHPDEQCRAAIFAPESFRALCTSTVKDTLKFCDDTLENEDSAWHADPVMAIGRQQQGGALVFSCDPECRAWRGTHSELCRRRSRMAPAGGGGAES